MIACILVKSLEDTGVAMTVAILKAWMLWDRKLFLTQNGRNKKKH